MRINGDGKMKKVLASVLVLVMLLCGLPPMAGAARENSNVKRYTVLVLDTSSTSTFLSDGVEIYTADTAIEYVQKASSQFLLFLFNPAGILDFSRGYDTITARNAPPIERKPI